MNQITDWFTGESQKAQTTADYDISQAYAAYKRQTMQAMNTASMAEGTKERIARESYAQYQNTASQITENLEESRANVSSGYATALNNWKKNVEAQADYYANLEGATAERAIKYGFADVSDVDGDYSPIEKFYMKYYIKGMEQERLDALQAARYSNVKADGTKMRDYELFSNEFAATNPELYEFAINNSANVNKYMLGADEDYVGDKYNWRNRQSMINKADALEKELKEKGYTVDKTDFENATEKYDYYNKIDSMNGMYKAHAKSTRDKVVVDGVEYELGTYTTSGATNIHGETDLMNAGVGWNPIATINKMVNTSTWGKQLEEQPMVKDKSVGTKEQANVLYEAYKHGQLKSGDVIKVGNDVYELVNYAGVERLLKMKKVSEKESSVSPRDVADASKQVYDAMKGTKQQSGKNNSKSIMLI